jgi:dTDP-4-dehydrorhamnose 3,5-epimerase
VKGWVFHKEQEDRIFTGQGVLRWVFFDNRPDSPTYKMLNDFTFSEHHRALIVIPRGVYHAVRNIGTENAYFVNMPSMPYRHGDPDKYRLPMKNDLIPFDFFAPPAW